MRDAVCHCRKCGNFLLDNEDRVCADCRPAATAPDAGPHVCPKCGGCTYKHFGCVRCTCAPRPEDAAEGPYWLVHYPEPGSEHEVIRGEAAARHRFEVASYGWTCTLFVEAKALDAERARAEAAEEKAAAWEQAHQRECQRADERIAWLDRARAAEARAERLEAAMRDWEHRLRRLAETAGEAVLAWSEARDDHDDQMASLDEEACRAENFITERTALSAPAKARADAEPDPRIRYVAVRCWRLNCGKPATHHPLPFHWCDEHADVTAWGLDGGEVREDG